VVVLWEPVGLLAAGPLAVVLWEPVVTVVCVESINFRRL